MTQPASVPRRTQAERRAASRERLLDAALACLADRGYAGTSLPEVLRRAQLSNGAMWRHFPSKAELMVAAALHSEQQLAESTAQISLDLLTPQERLDVAVDQVWRFTTEPAFLALIELLHASRADLELAEAMRAADRQAGEIFFDIVARCVGPTAAAHPDFQRNVRLLGLVLYGVGLTCGLRGSVAVDSLRHEVQQVMHVLFEPGAGS
jgi:AcrR family transcriptional regulator